MSDTQAANFDFQLVLNLYLTNLQPKDWASER